LYTTAKNTCLADSGRTSLFAATAEAAAVRLALIQTQSMTASGILVSGSLIISNPVIYDNPFLAFSGKPLTHFRPDELNAGI
jgi:hypothetical protein